MGHVASGCDWGASLESKAPSAQQPTIAGLAKIIDGA